MRKKTVISFLKDMQDKINNQKHKIGFTTRPFVTTFHTIPKGEIAVYKRYKELDDDGIWTGRFSYTYYFIANPGDTVSGYISIKHFINICK